jgi:DNA/RNA endonuclease YhcR with UshA esterase domain
MRFSVLIFAAGLVCAVLVPCGAGTRSTANAFWKDSSQGSSTQGASSQGNSPQDCIPIADARKHIGKTNCVTGTVVRVENGNNGVTYLDFCADYRTCPFTVVVFGADLRKVGDVRQLQGRAVSIKGRIEEYDERAEIILRHAQQLGGGAALLTAIPKGYDVEQRGHYSAGSPSLPKAKKAKRARQGRPIPLEDPED